MFAFFAPLGDLQVALDEGDGLDAPPYEPLSARSIMLRLDDAAAVAGGPPAACRPALRVVLADGAELAGRQAVRTFDRSDVLLDVVARLLGRVGRDAFANDVWARTMTAMITALRGAAEPSVLDDGQVVWRGVRMTRDKDALDVLRSMGRQFVSTSYSIDTALGFARATNDADTESWLLQLSVESNVLAIDVLSVLPRVWRCFVTEREVLIMPGGRYELLSASVGEDGVRRLVVAVGV
jgi:hypothetical protein